MDPLVSLNPGDIFSCHAIDNPDIESEMAMLQRYGPDVPKPILRKLVLAFSELRSLADQGLIAYPYSTREVVNMVKHLQRYPDEGLPQVVKNVFDFDAYNNEIREQVVETLHKHGIPIGASIANVQLAKEFPLPPASLTGRWLFGDRGASKRKMVCPVDEKKLRVKRYPDEGLPQVVKNVFDFDAYNNEIREQVVETLHKHGIPIGASIANVQLAKEFPLPPASLTGRWLFGDRGASKRKMVCPVDEKKLRVKDECDDGNDVGTDDDESNEDDDVETCNDDDIQTSLVKKTSTAPTTGGSPVVLPDSAQVVRVLNSKQVPKELFPNDLDNSPSSSSLPLKVSHTGLSKAHLSSVIGENMDAPNRLMADPQSYGAVAVGFPDLQVRVCLSVCLLATVCMSKAHLSSIIGENMDVPNRLIRKANSYSSVAVGFPDLQSSVDVYSAPRPPPPPTYPSGALRDPLASLVKKTSTAPTTGGSPVVLPDSAQVVRVLNSKQVPKELFPNEKVPGSGEFLEIADMSSQTLKYIPIPSPTVHRNYTPWVSDSKVLTAPTPSEGVVTVDTGGHVRLWETGRPQLSKSLADWYKMIGGRDTAGLGGIGGPFRLDAGHDVHQVTQAAKDAVPEEVRRAAREMGQKAYKAKLKEIEMSEYDAETYERFSDGVKRQVTSLRVILDSLQAKSKERQWIKHQTSGDLDEVKLIEGLTGEKAIYKRRGEQDPEMGSPQEHPKRLKLVVDVSGSMYRFNGHDGRLDRTLQAICMAMEAFEGYEEKFAYDIVGHSGETCDEIFLKSDKVPKNNNERLKVLRNLHAHAQFCLSGDNTVEAAKTAIEDITKEEADEYFVIILSDANLDRYGISPKVLSRVMQQDEDVNAYAIFIGSIGDQAGRLVRNLPAGHGFVCMDTKTIPQIMQQIFTSTMLK
eukprot:XP_011670963.1 PREDICTED: von Willebrand factor A domain-containing protein 8 [Strongylocentrotus purpuratus]